MTILIYNNKHFGKLCKENNSLILSDNLIYLLYCHQRNIQEGSKINKRQKKKKHLHILSIH